jgi:hypothetical protein
MPTLIGWGSNSSGQINTPSNLAANGTVDTADISLLLLSFGPCG